MDPYVHVQYQAIPNSRTDPPERMLEIIIGGGFRNSSAHELAQVADLLDEAVLRVRQAVDLLMRGTRINIDENDEEAEEDG